MRMPTNLVWAHTFLMHTDLIYPSRRSPSLTSSVRPRRCQLHRTAMSQGGESAVFQPLQHGEGGIEAILDGRLAEQLHDFAQVLLASRIGGCSVLESAAATGRRTLLRAILTVFQPSAIPPADLLADLRAASLAAASNGHPQCLQLLLDSCSSSASSLQELLDARNPKTRNTPLMVAAAEGHVECLRLLLEHSPQTQVAAQGARRWTALLHAAASGHADCVRLLLEHSPAVQLAATAYNQDTALLRAALRCHASCVQLLLAHRPEVQVAAVSQAGWNALMCAAAGGSTSCVEQLLAHSPDIQLAVVSDQGLSALSIAANDGHVDCLQLLLAHSPPQQQQQLDRALLEAGQELARPQGGTGGWSSEEQQRRLRLKQCVELLLASGAMLPAQASEGAIAAIRPISKELAARARVPDMANQAVVGLALAAAGCKRHGSGGMQQQGPPTALQPP